MAKVRKTPDANLERLRAKAEALQQKLDPHKVEDLTATEAQKLIQELHLYQIELEMQNEQLRQVTEELVSTVDKYEDLYDFAPIGYVTLDEYGLVMEANLASARIFNLDRHLLLQSRFSRLVAPEHFDVFTAFLRRLRESDNKETCEITCIRPDKTVLEMRLEGIATLARNPDRLQCRIALIDITEQVKARHQMEESQHFIQKIADTMPDILTVYDLEKGRNLYGNREILTLLGLHPDKIRKAEPGEMLKLVHPDDVPGFMQSMQETRHLKDGEISEFEYRIKNHEGRWLWLRVRSVVFQRGANGLASQILSVQHDVTFRKEAEEALRYKDQIITGLQANMPIIVSIIQPDGIFSSMTGSGLAALENAGYRNLVGQNIYTAFPDLKDKIESVFRDRQKVSYLFCLGEEGKLCYQNYVFLDDTLNAAISFSIDISEQVAAEKSIYEQRNFSQSLLDNSIDGILAFDTELRFTAWNKVMEKNTRFKKEQMLGQKMFDLFPPFVDTEVGRAVVEVLLGQPVKLVDQDFGVKGASFEVYLNPLFDENGKVSGGLCILHDVKSQKKLEAETLELKLEQQKSILNAVLNTQEEERKRIAEALHNGLGQLLYAAKLNLDRNTKHVAENNILLKELLDEAIRESRTLSFELMPRILEDFGLETAISELISRLNKLGLKLDYQTAGMHRLNPSFEIAVYRISQELLNNIIKHSKATEATLSITLKGRKLTLIATDNGVGFNQEEVLKQPKGIGLTSILNRVKLLNGTLEISSTPQVGTSIKIELKVS